MTTANDRLDSRFISPTDANMNRFRSQLAGAIGSLLEWYDFAIFGFLAPIMGPLFFPHEDPIVALIQTYGVFAAGYLMRPIGGLVFGYVADRIGRTHALRWSIAAMAVPTVLVGLLPTYAQVGVWSAAMLILLRLIQGVSVGGELVTSVTFLVESAPQGRRGFYGSWAFFGAVGGILLGSGVVAFIELFIDNAGMTAGGWRIPFLLGLVIFLFGNWLRSALAADPVKTTVAESMPIKIVLTQHLGSVFHLIAAMLLFSISFYILFVWMPTYQSKIIPNPVAHAMVINTVTMALMLMMIPIAGWLADKFGFRRVMLLGIGLTGILAYPLFLWIDTGTLIAALVAGLLFAVITGLVQGPMPALLAQTFPANIRNTGVGLAYNVTLAVFGGTAPMVCTWLIKDSHNIAAPAYYLAALAAISFVAMATLKDHNHT